LSEEASLLCEEAYKLITQNRLDNVISKIGEVNPKKDYGKLLGLYNKDVLTDFLKNFQDKYDALEKHESKAVNKFVNKHAGQLITDYLTNKEKPPANTGLASGGLTCKLEVLCF